MKQYPFIASRIFGTPLLIEPGKLQVILAAVGERVGVDAPLPLAQVDEDDRRRAGYSVSRGVAVMSITGTLVARSGWMGAMSGMVSYQSLRQSLATYLGDDDVEQLLIDMSSFGGEAEMAGETAALIRQASLQKPITAIAHDYAASAAYWLGSAASRFVATRSAEVGSIGVVVTHQSIEGAVEKAGVKITHIHAGDNKVDYSPYFDLSDAARGRLQARVDDLYDLFVESVAEYRGVDPAVIRKTEARMLGAEEAARTGLIDEVVEYDALISTMQTGPSAVTRSTSTMSGNAISTVAQLREQYPSLCAEIDAAAAAGVDAKVKAAVDGERERMRSIMDHPEAKSRQEMARELAFTEGMTAETAGRILAKAPLAATLETSEGESPFASAMNNSNPRVAPDQGQAGQDQAASMWNKALGMRQ